ncbi:MAG: hypothetical protein WC551_09030 [Patescibacteria group bacterium]
MDVRTGIAAIVAAHKVIPLNNTPTDVAEPLEIISERTATAKIFDIGNGERQAHIYPCPVHYKTPEGTFVSIDPAVKRKPLLDPLPGFQYEVKSGLYHAHFDKDRPWNYRFCLGDAWVEYEALFEESESLTIKVETSRVGVKETVTLKDKSALVKLQWRVTWSSGESVIITPAIAAVDASGKRVPASTSESDGVLTCELDISGATFPITVDPSSVVATNDGFVNSADATFDTARNAAAGDYADASSLSIGLTKPSTYSVYRTFCSFAIPDMSAVSAASFFAYGLSDASTTDFEIYIHTSTYSDPLVKEDFDLFDGHQATGAYNGTVLNNTWDSSSYSATWNEIVFNAAGKSAVLAKKADTLKLVLISKEDFADSAPTGSEGVMFCPSTESGKEPYLSITFTPPQLPAPRNMDTFRHRRV